VKLLLIRHAIAVPSGTMGLADDERRLTQKGRRRFRRAARGLARIVPRPDVFLSSPLPRAFETAELAAKAWGRVRPRAEPALAGDGARPILELLARQPTNATVALVGHEPTLSALLAELLASRDGGRLTFRKGGAALLDVTGAPEAGGHLIWYLRPRILRILGR
jgi:phosphohistidine phosphatase